jgi:hypothetical protein
MLSRTASLLGLWAVGAVLLWWPHLPAPWRRRIALCWGVAGLVALVVAVTAEGLRETPNVAVFLMGAPYVTSTASAAASLPFYLLSGVCLFLGFAGLATGDQAAHFVDRHWLGLAISVSMAVTAVRFALEKTAAPAGLTQLVGVTWLAPVVGAFFSWNLKREGRGLRALLQSLFIYALAVRGSVALLMLVATHRRLGSHYDVSSVTLVRNPLTGQIYSFEAGSLAQLESMVLLPQLGVWPIYTLLAGLLGAVLLGITLEAKPTRIIRGPCEAHE